MDNPHVIWYVLVAAVVTAALRFAPFLIFGRGKETPALILYLGKVLPAAVMGFGRSPGRSRCVRIGLILQGL